MAGGAGAPCPSHTREAVIEAGDVIDGDNQANSNFTQKEDLP
jgi:hypothetical protein